jgi:inhibitor of cysteine peptidase
MKRSIPPIVAAAMLVAIPLMYANAASPLKKGSKAMQVTDADNGKTIKTAAETSFDIALKGNATTGFQWKVEKIEGKAVKQKGKNDYVPDKHEKDIVGFGGTFVFHFDVTKEAKTKIRLVYVRPWEKDTPPAKTFAVVIDSTPAPPPKSR